MEKPAIYCNKIITLVPRGMRSRGKKMYCGIYNLITYPWNREELPHQWNEYMIYTYL